MAMPYLLLVAATLHVQSTAESPQAVVSTLSGNPRLVAGPPRPNGTQRYRLLGDQQQGVLAQITRRSVMLQTDDEDLSLRLDEVATIRLQQELTRNEIPANEVELTDGSQVRCADLQVDAQEANLVGSAFGDFPLDRRAIRSVRFRDSQALQDEWDALARRSSRNDFLVVEKEKKVGEGDSATTVKTLDHLQGVVTGITADQVQFRLDGNEVNVKRANIFGVIYAVRDAVDPEFTCWIETRQGDRIRADRVTCDGEELFISSSAGERLITPLSQITQIDFSPGRVTYLSDLEPRDVKYTPYFDLVHEYRRDTNQVGQSLRLSGKSFERGLYIHSKTQLTYRLDGEYRRFQAVMGIDQLVEPNGDVHVIIRGDGQVLLETDVRGSQDSRIVDLDVTDILELEILVDFGGDLDISDHLDLAEARLLRD